MTNKQPNALRLADALDAAPYSSACTNDAAAELRRLHAINAEFVWALQSMVNHLTDDDHAIATSALSKAESQQ